MSRYSGTSPSPEVIKRVKEMLYDGRYKQVDIGADCGVSQSTISRIKNGLIGPDVPWPNGSTGAIPDAVLDRITLSAPDSGGAEGEMEAAYRFDAFPESMQEMIVSAVNAQRVEMGKDAIDLLSEREREYLLAPITSEEDRGARLEMERERVRRKGMVMVAFDEIIQSRLLQIREERMKHLGQSVPTPTDTEESMIALVDAQVDKLRERDLTYEKVRWETVVLRSPNNLYVRRCLKSADKVLREAVCIVFATVSPQSWGKAYLWDQIVRVYELLQSRPEVVRRIEVEG